MHNTQIQNVKVVDFDMSIGSLIGLFIKMAIAAIPAMIILWFLMLMLSLGAISVLGIGGAMLGG